MCFQNLLSLLLVAICYLNLCNNVCFGENILVPIFVSTKSHKMTYMPLIEELGKRGHNITVLSPIKPTKQMKNVKEILTLDVDKMKESFVTDPFEMKQKNVRQQPFSNVEWFTKVCRESYDLPQVKSLMEESFDLIFIQPMLNECVLGLVYRIKAPMVFFSPVAAPNFLADRVGCHFPHSFTPNIFTGLTTEMSFYERLFNFGYDIWLRVHIKYIYSPAIEEVYREKVGPDVPSIDEMLNNVSLILSNGHFSLYGHKPLLPDIVEIGGLHSRPPKALPQNLEDFIEKGKDKGFIYFSMGSAIKAHTMPEDKRQLFLNVFSRLKQQVIWKWETEAMPNLPPNVMLSKFLPQQDLLGHKNVKLFISHCGGGSTEEALYHAVPVIALPMFGDQPQNAKQAKVHGYIIELDWNELTEDLLFNSIQEILNNPIYNNNARRISAIYKDQPEDPMTRAVYWVEYVLRHKGATHLRSAGRKLNFWQYHSIDVILTYLIIVIVLALMIYKLTLCIFHVIMLRCLSRQNADKARRKKE